MTATGRPVLIIVDGSVAITGALVSAARQAELLAEKVNTVLALPRGHRVPPARLGAFAEVIEIPIVPLRKSLGSLLAYGPALVRSSRALRRAMRRLGCDRLQVNDFYLMQGSLLRLLGFRGRIVTFVRIDPTRFGAAGRLWLRAAWASSTEFVAVSRFIQRQLEPSYQSRLVYEQISPSPARQRRAKGPMTLLFVGNFIDGKGQEDAIAAFHRISAEFTGARLRFIGGDMGLARNRAYRARLERLASAGPGANRIEFRAASNDLLADYAGAQVALNFSASESFSMTCLEASAAGLPVIATRCGGPEEIINDGSTGFLVPVGDVAAMAERMTRLLAHPDDAAAMGEAGRALVAERFSPGRARKAFSVLFNL